MAEKTLFEKIANNNFIHGYLSNTRTRSILDLFIDNETIRILSLREPDFAEQIVKGGIKKGISSYLFQLLDPYVIPSTFSTINHLSNREAFSEEIYVAMFEHPFVDDPSLGVEGHYEDALYKLSELSEIIAEDFNKYVDLVLVDSMKSKRIF